jgi:hypothetical protein
MGATAVSKETGWDFDVWADAVTASTAMAMLALISALGRWAKMRSDLRRDSFLQKKPNVTPLG